jgi:hypothetical protein
LVTKATFPVTAGVGAGAASAAIATPGTAKAARIKVFKSLLFIMIPF